MFSNFDHKQLSLQECCNDLACQHQRSLSKVALHKRFNRQSLDLLKLVLAEQIASKLNLEQEHCWQPFTRVMLSDSCKFSLPKQYKEDYPGYGNFASAMMNIQYSFDLKQGDWENLEFTQATQNDQGHSKKTLHQICKGDLHIRDLGYITPGYLLKVTDEEAFFLNRLPPQWKPVQCSTGKAVDWTALYQQMKRSKNNQFETMISIRADKSTFDCRLIAIAVPEQVWTERIRKAQQRAKSMGHPLSDAYKMRCRFSIFITNVSEQTLKATDIILLYRLRWQIELVFKTWKSLMGIHQVKAVKKERLECQLLAKFIWILLNWKIFRCISTFIQQHSPKYACSIWKFFKNVRQYTHSIRNVINSKLKIDNWLEIFIFPIIPNLMIEPKKGKKPAFEIVNDVFYP
jgi:hypothetical protein